MGSLIEGYSLDNIFSSDTTVKKKEAVFEIETSKIKVNKNQPRKNFNIDSLKELAQSIKNQGIIQPIIVEKINNNEYSIIAGERRYRAAKMAGLKSVPVFVKELNNLNRLEIALI